MMFYVELYFIMTFYGLFKLPKDLLYDISDYIISALLPDSLRDVGLFCLFDTKKPIPLD